MAQIVCPKCNGETKVGNTTLREPWSYWKTATYTGGLAVRMGLVKSMTCPTCNGLGVVTGVARG